MTTSNVKRKILVGGIVLLLVLAVGELAAAQTCVQPPDGLVSWWPLDETIASGTVSDIAGPNPGTVNGATLGVAGNVGTAASFDGVDDFISFGTGPSITGTGPFTVDAWVKTMDSEGVIVQQRDSGGFNGEYILSVGGFAFPGFAFAPGKVCWTSFGDGNFGFNFCSNAAVNDGSFHHITSTREADGTGRIYIDGVLDTSHSAPARTLVTLAVFVGADKRDNQRFLDGIIDEVELYNRALSADEIEAIFNAGGAGKCKGPAAILKLVGEVFALNLQRGIANSLDAKLDAAVEALDDINQNNNIAAVNALQAFINAVQAQRGVHIADTDADALITSAQQVIAYLIGP